MSGIITLPLAIETIQSKNSRLSFLGYSVGYTLDAVGAAFWVGSFVKGNTGDHAEELVWTPKWPFQGLSDLHLGNQKVTLKKLVDFFLVVYKLICLMSRITCKVFHYV